jgi:hypothetical protein
VKKTYITPALTVHGDVAEITQAFGDANVNDTIYYANRGFPGDGGSRDGIVVPK